MQVHDIEKHMAIKLEEIKKRLYAVHKNTVLLDESTYVNIRTKATFIHARYGLWDAIPDNVLRGHTHPRQTHERGEVWPRNTKRCSVCKDLKDYAEFHKRKEGKYGIDSRCKECEYKRNSVYRQNNIEDIARKELYRYHNDMQFRAIKHARIRVNTFLKGKNKFSKCLGCSFEDFIKYFESQFQSGMTWDNYGDWEIDHKKCLALAYLEGPESFAKACHYTNLQPLWLKDHFIKTAEDVRSKKSYENNRTL